MFLWNKSITQQHFYNLWRILILALRARAHTRACDDFYSDAFYSESPHATSPTAHFACGPQSPLWRLTTH